MTTGPQAGGRSEQGRSQLVTQSRGDGQTAPPPPTDPDLDLLRKARAGTSPRSSRRGRPRSPRGRTGTCGSGRSRCGRTTRTGGPTPPGGTRPTAASARSARTPRTWAFGALNVADLWQPDPAGARRTIRVRAEWSDVNPLSFPKWERVRWVVPARGGLPPVTFTWHHGPGFPPGDREFLEGLLADRGVPQAERAKLLGYAGAVLIGSRGVLVADDHNVKVTLLPAETFRGVTLDRPKSVPASRGHYHDWFHACRGGEPAWAHFGYAGPLSEFLMLGNVATRFDAELEYDPAAGAVVNHPAADRVLGYEYRTGWTL